MQPIKARLRLIQTALAEGMIGRVMANISWLTFGNIVTAAVAILINLWIARYLGPHDYGIYAFALSVVLLLSPIAELGVNAILVRELSRDADREPSLMGSGALLRGVGALVVFLVGLLAVLIFVADDPRLQRCLWISLLALLPRLLSVTEAPLDARLESRYIVMARVLASLGAAVLRAGALLADLPLEVFIWLAVLHVAVEAGAAFAFYLYRGGRPRQWRVQLGEAGHILRAAWPLALAGISSSVLVRFDQVMLQNALDESAVGYYSAALLFTEGPSFLPMVVCVSVFPALVRVREISADLYQKRNQQFHDLVIWIGILLAIAIQFIAPWVVILVLGEAYEPTLSVLRILPWCTMMVAGAVVQSQYMVVENLQWVGSLARVVGCGLNVVLNWLWIPRYGIEGAAWASLISYMVIVLVVPALVPSTRVCLLHFVKAVFAPVRYLVHWRTPGP